MYKAQCVFAFFFLPLCSCIFSAFPLLSIAERVYAVDADQNQWYLGNDGKEKHSRVPKRSEDLFLRTHKIDISCMDIIFHFDGSASFCAFVPFHSHSSN